MHTKKHLSFSALRKSICEVFRQIDDRRQSGKVDFTLHDCLMSALAMMFFQDPSLLSFQFQWVEELDGLGGVEHMERVDQKGRRHHYRWVNQVPLNGTRNADHVNFFEYWLIVDQKTTYHNSWVTDQAVNRHTIVERVKAGRARWKIENETFNTLKNQGYHLEHNFGHGRQYLSNNFFVLNLLAFFIHQILELCDRGYQYCRSKFSSRKEYWNSLRAAIKLMLFHDFEHLLRYVADPPDIWAPD